jgi:integrase
MSTLPMTSPRPPASPASEGIPPTAVSLALDQFQDWLLANGYAPAALPDALVRARELLVSLPTWPTPLTPDEVFRHLELAIEQRTTLSPAARRQYKLTLHKLRKFLYFQQGALLPPPDPFALPARLTELPEWLRDPLARYLCLQQRQWPTHAVREKIGNLLSRLCSVISFFIEHCQWTAWNQLSTRWGDAYIEAGLRRRLSPSTLNVNLYAFVGWCRFALEEGLPVPPPLLHFKALPLPARLPRPLTDEQVRQLEQCIQTTLAESPRLFQHQQALMDLAWFYLLWHCGLRVGEVQRLRVSDIDLAKRQVFIHLTKERKDRVIYISETTAQALQQHLTSRPDRDSTYVFTYRSRLVTIRTIERRLLIYGQRIRLSVTPHRLRHTFASQMLAAGMPITSLQRYLGHEHLDTTMLYAQVSDPMLQQDYYRGIAVIDPHSPPPASSPASLSHREELAQLINRLRSANPNSDDHEAILEQMHRLVCESPEGVLHES